MIDIDPLLAGSIALCLVAIIIKAVGNARNVAVIRDPDARNIVIFASILLFCCAVAVSTGDKEGNTFLAEYGVLVLTAILLLIPDY
jgi:hypothetical protein